MKPDCAIRPSDREAVIDKTEIESVFDIEPDEALEASLDAEADADITAGRVIPHDHVSDWLTRLAKGERVPPPSP